MGEDYMLPVGGYDKTEMSLNDLIGNIKDKSSVELAKEQIVAGDDEQPLQNPLHDKALTIFDLHPEQEIFFYQRTGNSEPKREEEASFDIYIRGTIESEPFFGPDNMWWVSVKTEDLNRYISRDLCLGILGVTKNCINDNGKQVAGQFNKHFFALNENLKTS